MTICELCERIGLQPEVRARVLRFAEEFDFAQVADQLAAFRDPETMGAAVKGLQECLGEDRDHIRILTCMVKAAADLHALYREQGIGEEIYTATMKCFPRFLEECRRKTGSYAFDREWWTARQAGGHLFRIGTLEYEIRRQEGETTISIHIPSDADLRGESCEASLKMAGQFFRRHFPQYAGCPYRCHSWMLAPELQRLLPEGSNILAFRRRFAIQIREGQAQDWLEWIYKTNSRQLSQLPEKTSLQRNLKTHLLRGGILSDAVGFLKENPKNA